MLTRFQSIIAFVLVTLIGTLLLTACVAPSVPATPVVTPSSPLRVTTPSTAPTSIPPPEPTALAAAQVEFVWKVDGQDIGMGEIVAPFVDKEGNLYFLDMESERVVKLDPDGKLLMTFGEHGSGEGQFNFQPVTTPLYGDVVYGGDLVVDQKGNIYVADGSNYRVQVFDAQGRYVRQWGKQGQGEGEFQVPWTIAIDGQDNIYVGDFTGYIQKFDSNGKFLGKLGAGQGTGTAQFSVAVHDVEADAQGNIYAADFKLPRVMKFDPTGKFLAEWKDCGAKEFTPSGLGVDTLGNLYVADASAFRVCKFDPQGSLLSTWGKCCDDDGEFFFGQAADVAIDPTGTVYVSDDGNNTIQKFRQE